MSRGDCLGFTARDDAFLGWVAVCDNSGGSVVGVKRGKVVDGRASRGEAEAMAVVEGMNKAVELGLRRVVFYCDYYALYCLVTHKWQPMQRKIAKLVNQGILSHKFRYFRLSLVTRNDLKFAIKLAREAIYDQMASPMEYVCGSSDNSKEMCDICLEYQGNVLYRRMPESLLLFLHEATC